MVKLVVIYIYIFILFYIAVWFGETGRSLSIMAHSDTGCSDLREKQANTHKNKKKGVISVLVLDTLV
eukprot:gene2498-1558_t